MSGYRFSITCPLCGGALDHVTSSVVHPQVSMESRAVAACAPCNHSFVIEVRLSSNRHAARRHRNHLDTVEHYARVADQERASAR